MSRRWLGAVASLAAAAAMAATAFANAPPRVLHPSAVRTVTPVLSMPVRDMQRLSLPGLMHRITTGRHFTQDQLAQLRQKLIASGYLNHAAGASGHPYAIPLKKLTPVATSPRIATNPTWQRQIGQRLNFTTGIAFPGLGVSDSPPDAIGCAPPDTNSAVGSGYVVEIVNLCTLAPGVGVFKVWDTSGNVVQGATSLGSLWSTSDCQNGGGDNEVLYDQFANRWIMSQFNSSYTGICMAVSQTSDPTGAYYLYDVVMDPGGFNDYPKFGLWVTGDPNSDAYLLSANDFPPAACGNCVVYTAAQRSAMLTGGTATIITFIGPNYFTGLDFSALPSDVDGSTMPPTDDPGMYVDYISPWYYGGTTYALEMWQMTPDFGTPNNSTLTGPTAINVDPFQDADITCIPQPSPGECLPALGDRLMFRLPYRNGNTSTSDQILLANHSVTADGSANPPIGIDWYELTAPAGATSASAWSIAQQGIYAPSDGNSRWMASISMDHMGNIGMGYTIAGPSLDPSIAVTGQNIGTTGGVMDAGESTLIAGTGVQEATGRWGDYSSIMVDPSDDCTFWTAQEYISATGSFNWSTGNGSFKFDNCSIGPTGTVTGTVTNESNGNAINNATVTLTPGNETGNTGNNNTGVYSITTAPGTYSAAASAFGFLTSNSVQVVITDGGTTTQDFSLTPAPTATIGGHVYDSGHMYPLLAEVKVKNNGTTVADVWTNPVNGFYSVTLPTGTSYTMSATPYVSGFTAGSASITLSGDTSQNFGLAPDSSCTAPGYQFEGGISQDFEGSFPPTGWTVVNDVDNGFTHWERNDSYGDGNYTNGTGYAAEANDDHCGPGCGAYSTQLISPPSTVTSLSGMTLMYTANWQKYIYDDTLDLDISTDGGNTWTNVLSWNSSGQDCGSLYSTPGCDVSQDLTSFLQGATSFQLRWHYWDDNSSAWDWYAQVDNVLLGAACQPIPGQLLALTATDTNTHQSLSGVTITDENGNSAVTGMNPTGGPPAALMFEPQGSHTLTATMNNYQDNVKTVNVSDGQGKTRVVLFRMQAGRLAARPQSLTVNAPVDTTTDVPLHIGDTGTAPVDWQLTSINAPPNNPSHGHGTMFHNIHCAQRVSPASLLRQGKQQNNCGSGDNRPVLAPNQASAWAAIANYPIPVADNAMATDESTGLVYSFGGVSNGVVTSSAYVYDPSSDSWSAISNLPSGLEKPVAAFINGLAYVTAGWDSSGNPNQTLYIYDPSSDTWTTGADDPGTQAGAPGVAVLGGELYVIGGCYDSFCDTTNVVEVYDPSTNTWSSATNYPHNVSWQVCGGIGSEVYCAGGYGAGTYYGDAQAYDPSSDTWTAVAGLPTNPDGCTDLWGGGGIPANGQLLVQDGVTCSGFDIVNFGFAYDPSTNSWSSLPNDIIDSYRMGSACGFYMVGGNPFTGEQTGEVLSGYDQCTVGSVPWLSFNPATGTLDPFTSTTSTLAIDGAGQTAGTQSVVQVKLSGNTPYGSITVPLTVNWTSAPARKHFRHHR